MPDAQGCPGPDAVRRFADDTRGIAGVEFALVCLPLFTLLLGVLQFALYVYQAHLFASAIHDISSNGAPKLSTITQPELVNEICTRARLGSDCPSTLVIEILPLASYSTEYFPVQPAFQPAGAKTIMLFRAQAVLPSFVPLIGDITTATTAVYVGT